MLFASNSAIFSSCPFPVTLESFWTPVPFISLLLLLTHTTVVSRMYSFLVLIKIFSNLPPEALPCSVFLYDLKPSELSLTSHPYICQIHLQLCYLEKLVKYFSGMHPHSKVFIGSSWAAVETVQIPETSFPSFLPHIPASVSHCPWIPVVCPDSEPTCVHAISSTAALSPIHHSLKFFSTHIKFCLFSKVSRKHLPLTAESSLAQTAALYVSAWLTYHSPPFSRFHQMGCKLLKGQIPDFCYPQLIISRSASL